MKQKFSQNYQKKSAQNGKKIEYDWRNLICLIHTIENISLIFAHLLKLKPYKRYAIVR